MIYKMSGHCEKYLVVHKPTIQITVTEETNQKIFTYNNDKNLYFVIRKILKMIKTAGH